MDLAQLAVCVLALALLAAVIAIAVVSVKLYGTLGDLRDALLAGANATRAQEVAELARDQEHVARIAADAGSVSDRIQLERTQIALAAAQKELAVHVHDLIANGPAATAADAFRRLFAQPVLPAAGDAGNAPAGGRDQGPSAVQPAEPASPGAAGPAPGPGR